MTASNTFFFTVVYWLSYVLLTQLALLMHPF